MLTKLEKVAANEFPLSTMTLFQSTRPRYYTLPQFLRWGIVVVVTISCDTHRVSGAITSFAFSGTISVDDPGGLLSADVHSGLTFDGLLTYDLDSEDKATPNWPADSAFYDPDMRRGVYVHISPDATFGLSLDIGNHSFQVVPDEDFHVHMTNDTNDSDSLFAFSFAGWLSDLSLSTSINTMALSLQDNDSEAFTSDSLPKILTAEQFEIREIVVTGATLGAESFQIVATIDSIVAVPEPATHLISVALLVLLLSLFGRQTYGSRSGYHQITGGTRDT